MLHTMYLIHVKSQSCIRLSNVITTASIWISETTCDILYFASIPIGHLNVAEALYKGKINLTKVLVEDGVPSNQLELQFETKVRAMEICKNPEILVEHLQNGARLLYRNSFVVQLVLNSAIEIRRSC